MDIDLLGIENSTEFSLPSFVTAQEILETCAHWAGIDLSSTPKFLRALRRTSQKTSYLLNYGEHRLVLSVPSRLQRDISLIAEMTAQAGISAPLVYSSFEKGFVVTEYVEGRCWKSADFKTLVNIERLAGLLKTLHGLPLTASELSIASEVNRYWDMMRSEYVAVSRRLKRLQQEMLRVIEYANRHFTGRVVCHNNILNAHVLETDDGLKLFGWEHAAINDPFYELAVIVHNHGFNELQLDHLLRCYAGETSSKVYKRFYYNYAIYIYLDALSYWLQGVHNDIPDHENEMESRVDVLVAILHRIGNKPASKPG